VSTIRAVMEDKLHMKSGVVEERNAGRGRWRWINDERSIKCPFNAHRNEMFHSTWVYHGRMQSIADQRGPFWGWRQVCMSEPPMERKCAFFDCSHLGSCHSD